MPATVHADARSQELNLGFPQEWKEHRCLNHSLLISRAYVSRRIELEAGGLKRRTLYVYASIQRFSKLCTQHLKDSLQVIWLLSLPLTNLTLSVNH